MVDFEGNRVFSGLQYWSGEKEVRHDGAHGRKEGMQGVGAGGARSGGARSFLPSSNRK